MPEDKNVETPQERLFDGILHPHVAPVYFVVHIAVFAMWNFGYIHTGVALMITGILGFVGVAIDAGWVGHWRVDCA